MSADKAAERAELKAAREMDWQQVVLNHPYGPPCFHLFDDKFCGRAHGWQGHGDPNHHKFVSFADLLKNTFEAGRSSLESENARLREALERTIRVMESFEAMERRTCFTHTLANSRAALIGGTNG